MADRFSFTIRDNTLIGMIEELSKDKDRFYNKSHILRCAIIMLYNKTKGER